MFATQFRPGWGEVDQDRVLHFPVIFRYFKETESQLYRHGLGIPRGDLLRELDIWMPRVETHCRFHQPIMYDQPLEMRMALSEIADKTITYAYQMFDKDAQSPLAEGCLRILIVSGQEFKAIPVPDTLKELLAPYAQQAPGACSSTGSDMAPARSASSQLAPRESKGVESQPTGQVFETGIKIASTDIDPAGLVYFGSYLYFLARAEDEFFRSAGYPLPRLEKEHGVKLFRREVYCRYKNAAGYDDRLEACIWVRQVAHGALTYQFEMRKEAQESLVAEGGVSMVPLARHDLQQVEIPEKLRGTFRKLINP